VKVKKEERRLGGSANVINNLCELGAKVSAIGVVGEDDAGKMLVNILSEMKVDCEGVVKDASRMTTQKSRVIAHSQQVVRVDREKTHHISASPLSDLSKVFPKKIESAKALIVSDYGKGFITPETYNLVLQAKEYNFGEWAKPIVIDPKGPNFNLYREATIVKPNRKEAAQASGVDIVDVDSAVEAGRILLKQWSAQSVMITMGDAGMVLVYEDGFDFVPTDAREVFDVSGAGDTVSAVFTLALAIGAKPLEAAQLANLAAGVVVQEIGTVPITKDQLITAIQKQTN
jgi:rfaE bifunctional protein kinase chain/domain